MPKRKSKAHFHGEDSRKERRNRALHALGHMRREHLSLTAAARLEHAKPATVLRYVGSAIRQDRSGGRYRATKADSFKRELRIPTALGPTKVPIYGSKAASTVAKYANAVNRYLRTGDTSRLDEFKNKPLRTGKRELELVTDAATLTALAQAGALHLDQLYASFAGTA